MIFTNPFKKTKTLHVWEYEPYAFERGRVYVIQLDVTQIDLDEWQRIQAYFDQHGVNVKLVAFRGEKPAILPITVKRMTEVIS